MLYKSCMRWWWVKKGREIEEKFAFNAGTNFRVRTCLFNMHVTPPTLDI